MTKPSNRDERLNATERLDATDAVAETSTAGAPAPASTPKPAAAETSATDAPTSASKPAAATRRRERILAGTLAGLLLATLVTSHAVSGVLARYATGATSTDTARVAYFGHAEKVELSSWVAGIKPGDTRTITLEVSNASAAGAVSEVAQGYDIELETAHNLPLTFSVTGDAGTAAITSDDTTPQGSGIHTYTFTSDDMVFEPSAATTHRYTITVDWPADANGSKNADIPDYVQASINVRQID